MEPFYEILGKFPDNLRESINDMVHVKPIAFLRGKTLDNAFIVVDEAQNITKAQIKLIFTRLGKYSKMVVCGDTNQFDIKNTGFTDAINRLSGVPGLIVARLTKEDIMRHGIIRKILERYEGLDDNEGSLEMSSIFPDSNDLIDE
jgi:phosphate starvation-inducible PhoH-like protein